MAFISKDIENERQFMFFYSAPWYLLDGTWNLPNLLGRVANFVYVLGVYWHKHGHMICGLYITDIENERQFMIF